MAKRKTAAAWRAFLRALARTGNARAAAAEAGMDVGTAYDRRIKDAGFAAKWDAAVVKAKAAALSPKASADKPELVLRRTRHGDKMVRAAPGRWCARTEASFLAGLEATGCVRSAAAAAGISTNALYARRNHYPDFAESWREVEGRAAEQLPALLRAAAVASLGESAPASAGQAGGKRRGLARLPKVNVDQAIAISRLKGGDGDESGRRRGRNVYRKPAPTREELTETLLKLLAVLKRRRRKAKLAEGWSEAEDGTLVPPGWARAP